MEGEAYFLRLRRVAGFLHLDFHLHAAWFISSWFLGWQPVSPLFTPAQFFRRVFTMVHTTERGLRKLGLSDHLGQTGGQAGFFTVKIGVLCWLVRGGALIISLEKDEKTEKWREETT